jgi:5'-nucleotidase
LALAASATLVPAPAHAADPVDINILATNDFHGRIRSNGIEAGAPVLAGAVKQIRGQHPNTVFAAAGDLIGASTFESFISHDKPTIDALNAAGLEVSAVGNHEFDQGYHDLVDRVMSPTAPEGGATWTYIGANVRMKDTGSPALDPTFVKEMDGVQVGFIGAVTEHLPELVSPAGIADITVTDIPTAVNAEADELKREGVDVVVLLVHEGAPSTDCAAMDDDPTSDFGQIVTGVDDNVDAIVSGHTHLAYNCSFPVADWAGRQVTERPVVSAGQYGYNLNQLDLAVDPATGAIQSVDQRILPLTTKNPDGTFTANYRPDPATQEIVDAAVQAADVKGAQPLGDIGGAFHRATRPVATGSGTEENRGGESTLGNLVAEAQRWATESPTTGGAQIAFMNPGGLRTDMLGNTPDSYPTTLTYKQAANVQPFANTLVNMRMTGAQIRTVLEQQWQPAGASRPFLRLGVSKGFTYTYDPVAHTITGMWLDGRPVEDGATYSVTVNSFLASGGDNFLGFQAGTQKQDTGKTDLAGMVDYMKAFASHDPLPVDYAQHAVGVRFPVAGPSAYAAGRPIRIDLSSLAMTGAGDVQDRAVTARIGDRDLGTIRVDNTVAPGATDDEAGRASVAVRLPAGVPAGRRTLVFTGRQTGTVVRVPVTVAQAATR